MDYPELQPDTPPATQALQLYCRAEEDHNDFLRALSNDDPAHATDVFAKQCFGYLLHGLWLMVMAMHHAQDQQ
jgi:hypothetical protein